MQEFSSINSPQAKVHRAGRRQEEAVWGNVHGFGQSMKVLLIHPPVSKPCEPPAGIARLAGALREHGIPCTVIDANVEGLHFLLNSPRVRAGAEIRGHNPIASENGIVSPDFSISSEIRAISPDLTEALKVGGRDRAGSTWTKRAIRSLPRHLQSLRSWPLYGHADRYRRAVADINRVLAGGSSQLTVAKGENQVFNPIPTPPIPLKGRKSSLRRRDNSQQVTVSLADYEDAALSPLQSADLLQSAAQPEKNPFYPYFRMHLMSLLKEQNPEIIGISVNYLSQALCAFAMIGVVRSTLPHGRIILGGGLITSWLRQPQWQSTCRGNMAVGVTDFGVDVLSHRSGGNDLFTGLVDDLVAGPGEEYLISLVSKDSRETTSRDDYKDLSDFDSGFSRKALCPPLLALPFHSISARRGQGSESTLQESSQGPSADRQGAGIAIFKGSFRETTQWGQLMACAVISVIPVIGLFLLGQKYFIKGVMIGAVKG